MTTQTRPGLTVLAEIARGGMGRVDLAVLKEGSFTRLYAVKRLHPHLREDEPVREMFLNEARITGNIYHPNVVSVVDVGNDDKGPFLVMDYVEGVPISTILGRLSRRSDRLPLSLALDIGAQMALGLHAAHSLVASDGTPLHLVHRDVSPQNVLVDYDGLVRITDFGIAKVLGVSSGTVTNMLLKGKVGYMSPEQLRFEPATHRADLFALGVLLFELCTSKRLYVSPSGEHEAARRILNDPPPDLGEQRADAPQELVGLLFELLAKNPAHRPENAAVVARRLRALGAECADGLTLADYMLEAFGERREDERKRIKALIAQAPASGAPLTAELPGPASAATPDVGSLGKEPSTERPARRWAPLGAAAALLAAGGGVMFYLSAAAGPPPVPSVANIELKVVQPPVPLAPSEPPATPAEPSADATATTPPPRPAPRRAPSASASAPVPAPTESSRFPRWK